MDGRQQRKSAVVHRTAASARYTFKDIHNVLFPVTSPDARSIVDFDEGIRDLMRRKHAPLDPIIPVKRAC